MMELPCSSLKNGVLLDSKFSHFLLWTVKNGVSFVNTLVNKSTYDCYVKTIICECDAIFSQPQYKPIKLK